jgi:NTE family protein
MIYKGKKSRLKTALILTGGGAKGAMQVGALKVILDKIIPDVIIGASIGGLNGAYIALDKPIEELEKAWEDVKPSIFYANPHVFWKFTYAESLYSGKAAMKWLLKKFGNLKFADCEIPLYINATRLSDGKAVNLHKGSVAEAVKASCAILPVLPPAEVDGVRYIDGDISSYLSTDNEILRKCKQLIIINAQFCNGHNSPKEGMLMLTQNAMDFIISRSLRRDIQILEHKKLFKNIVHIEPDPNACYSIADFKRVKELLKLGELAAKKQLKKIIV